MAHAQEDTKRWPDINSSPVFSLEGENPSQTAKLVDMAEDNEKKRRMSVPFSQTLVDEVDLRDTSDHVTTMQEELLHLFAIHDVSGELHALPVLILSPKRICLCKEKFLFFRPSFKKNVKRKGAQQNEPRLECRKNC